ncbi:MAG: 30S ribosomal protein S9, partial [Kiritimatiellae bacterium]|nr:30S ribosomal protein S9 [Kiritimatiellia bacterium]
MALEDYITSEALRDYLTQPIAISGFDASKVDVIVFAKGGGCSGQAGAIRHGLARALVEA